MKKLWMVCLLCFAGLHLVAQDLVYSNLKDLLANDGNLVEGLKVEKRTKTYMVVPITGLLPIISLCVNT